MASNTLFTIQEREFELHRYPQQQKNRSLQAWDSADELLINHIAEHITLDKSSRVVLVNDHFGALSCYFADSNCSVINDSWISHLGITQNLTLNGITEGSVALYSPLDISNVLATPADLLLIKIPKQLDALNALLTSLLPCINANTIVIGAGKAKEIHTSTLTLFKQCFGDVSTSLAVKKSRLIFAKQPKQERAKPYQEQDTRFFVEHLHKELRNLPNVFSGKQLDIGARAIIPHLPSSDEQITCIDLGCGNGVLGLTLLAQCPNAQVTFIDESFSAVATAKMNVEHLYPDTLQRCTFMTNDCLENVEPNSADWVICNPPFHQQSAITDHIAWQMFVGAKRTLKKHGKLLVVGNAHLGYQQKLQRLFSKVTKQEHTKKFVILLGEKS